MPGDNGLSDLLAAVGMSNQELVKNSAAAKEIVAGQAQASQEAQDAVSKQGDAAGIISKAKDVATQHAESIVQKQAAAMGANPDESGEIMTTLASGWKNAAINAEDKASKLEHDLSISFFEHPLDYVVAHINMDKTIQQADAAVAHRESAFHALSEAHKNVQDSVASANALKSTVTDATMQANLDTIAGQIDQKKAELKLQNGGIQLQGLRDLGSMSLQQVTNLSSAYTAQTQAEQLQIAKRGQTIAEEHLQLAKQSADLQKKEWEQKVADKSATKEDLKNIADTVRAGAAASGIQLPDSDSKVVTMFNMKQAHYLDWFNAGVVSNSTGKPIVSDNPGVAARMVVDTNAPLRPEQGTVKTLLVNSWTKAVSPQGGLEGKYDNTKKDQVTQGAGVFAVKEATKMMGNIDPKDGSNIYAAPPLTAVTQVPAIQTSKWYSSVLKPHMATGELREFQPEQLTSMTIQSIKDGQISFKDAVDGLQGVHAAAMALNNSTKNYTGFGLPDQKGFKVRLSATPGFSLPRTFDLSTTQDVTNLLMSRMNAEQQLSIRNNYPTQ
jgi:hypothetical protein